MSLRLRLTLWYSGLLIVVLGVLGFSVHSLMANRFQAQTRSDLVAEARYVQQNYTIVPASRDKLTAKLPNLSTFSTPGLYIELLGADGRVLSRSDNLGNEQISLVSADRVEAFYRAKALHKPSFIQVSVRGNPLELYYTPLNIPLTRNSAWHYVLVVAKSRADNLRTLQIVTVGLVGGGMILLALLIFFTWLAAGAALQPIGIMTQRAATIASTRDFSGRVPLPPRLLSTAEFQRLAVTFNHMLASLEEAYAAQQRFLADASHELRTPLTAVRANLDFLEAAPDASPIERTMALQAARREAERMGALVSDLLALSRADSGQTVDRRPVEMDRVIVDAYRRMKPVATDVQLQIGRLDEIVLQGDSERLVQLVLILLDNALKYTPAGGRITLSLERVSPTRVAICVADTGIGVPLEERTRIFERFYRSPAARARGEGSGLGLPIAQWIARAHGGDVEVRDGPEGGSEFVVTLPAIAAATNDMARTKTPASVS